MTVSERGGQCNGVKSVGLRFALRNGSSPLSISSCPLAKLNRLTGTHHDRTHPDITLLDN